MNSRTVEAKLAGSESLAPPATISRHARAVLAHRTRTSTGLHPGPGRAAPEAAARREIFRPEREVRELQQLRHLPRPRFTRLDARTRPAESTNIAKGVTRTLYAA